MNKQKHDDDGRVTDWKARINAHTVMILWIALILAIVALLLQ